MRRKTKLLSLLLSVIMILSFAASPLAYATSSVDPTFEMSVTPQSVVEKVAAPGHYVGFYDEEDLYPGTQVHNVYVEVPAAYKGAFKSDPNAREDEFIKLAVTYVLPADAEGNVTIPEGGWPALIQCCRYDTAPSTSTGRYNGQDTYYVKRGYVVMRVDLRGMGASGGIAKGFGTRENGLDVNYIIDNWLPTQSWYSGKCAMYGSSNQGVIGNTTGVTTPDGLAGYQVGVASIDYYSQKYNNGVSIANNGWGSIPNLTNPWSVDTFTNELAEPASPDNPIGIFKTYPVPVFDEEGQPVMVPSPFGGLTQKTETHVAIDEEGKIESYEEWIKHPTAQFVDDDSEGRIAYQHYVIQQTYNEMFFTWMTVPNMYRDSKDANGWEVYEDIVLFEEIGNVVKNGIETYNYGGYQDIASTAQLATATLTNGHIVLSNGNHGGAMTGGDFTKSALGFSSNEDFVRYFDHLLKGVDNGFESAPFAYYYLLDTADPEIATYNPAHYAEKIPLAKTNKTDFYFNNDTKIQSTDVKYLSNTNNGTLSTVKPQTDSFAAYNVTQDVIKLDGGINFDITGMSNGPVGINDLSQTIDNRSVTFTTEPFTESFTYLGNGTMDIWASCDNADDFDLIGMLELVKGDGTSHYLSRGTIRASHREGVEAGSDQAKLWDTIGLTDYEHNSLEASVKKMLEEGLKEPVLLKFNLELAGVKINEGDSLRVTLFNVTHRSGAPTQSYMYYDKDGNLLPDEQLPHIKYYTGGEHASKMTLPVYTSVDNTLNGTVTFTDGSYCGPATMYLLDDNYYVQFNGDWLKFAKTHTTMSMYGVPMTSANPEINYVVDSNGVAYFYNAGFTFRPEGTIIADAQAQVYRGEDAESTYSFPSTFEGYQGTLAEKVSLRQGDYYGVNIDGVVEYKGIQYGKAPLFQAPQAMPNKAEDADVIYAFDHGMSTSGAGSADPDCLNLSVYVNPNYTGKRTVFMWVFGSANSGGAVGSPDWTNFVKANPNIIVVTPTHRGGLLGSADLSQLEGYNDPKYLDENGENIYRFSNNIARLDIFQVLKWIKENIEAFGGNPDDVAIGGQSSGGNLCASVMMMPASKDLWDKALLQESFPLDGSLMPLDEAKVVAANTFKTLKVSTMEEFLNLPAASYRSYAPADFGYKALSPVVDDIVLKADYFDQLLGKDGLWAGKPVLFGCNEGGYDQMYTPGDDAANLVTARGRSIGNLGSISSIGKSGWYDHSAVIDGESVSNVADWIVERFVANENEDYPERNGNYAAKDLDQDFNLRVPGLLFAEAASQNTDVYYYRLNFNSSGGVTHQRAAHGSENSVISLNWTATDRNGLSAAARQVIGDKMAAIWASFITTGNPNGAGLGVTWTPYTSENHETLIIGDKDFSMANGVRNKDTAVVMPTMREYTKLMYVDGIPAISTTNDIDTIVANATVKPYGLPTRATSGVIWTKVSETEDKLILRATIKNGITNVLNGTKNGYSLGVETSDFVQDFEIQIIKGFTLNGTVKFDNGSYNGPATMYVADDTYTLSYNGKEETLDTATDVISYTVNPQGVADFYNAGFTFRPEGEVINSITPQTYQGDAEGYYAFPEFDGYEGTIVELRQGDYLGNQETNGTFSWKGVQYAKAPLFQVAQQLPDKVDGAEPIEAYNPGAGTSRMNSANENCLDLEVFVNPDWDIEKDGPRAVFMWVFGSANMGGAANSNWANFVKDNPGIIVVAPTHRGGALGSIDLSVLSDYNDEKYQKDGKNIYEAANNIARLDILEVLKWINANIAAFGGDPENVAIGGQSSGGNLCASVMMMPESKELWDKALLQESFPLDGSLMPLDEAQYVAKATFDSLNIKTIDELLTYLSTAKNFSSVNPADMGYKAQCPVVDDVVIKADYYDQLLGENGLWAGKPVLFGNNEGCYDQMYSPNKTDEENLTTARNRSIGNVTDKGWYNRTIGNIEDYDDYVINQYKANSSIYGRNGVQCAQDLDNDLNMRVPSLLYAEAASQNTDVYYYQLRFNSSSTVDYKRAGHGSENSVIMKTWVPNARGTDPKEQRAIIAERISDIWAQFILTGDPNNADLGGATWTKYVPGQRNTMILDKDEFYMVDGVRNEDIDVIMPIMREYSKLITIEGMPTEVNSDNKTGYQKDVKVGPLGLPGRSSGITFTTLSETSNKMVVRVTVKDGITNVVNGTTKGFSRGVETSDFVQDFEIAIKSSGSGSGSSGGGSYSSTVSVKSVALDKTSATLVAGGTLKLTATVSPANATDPTVQWTTSNANVATVDANGNVKALAKGTVTITAKAGSKSATCTLTVEGNAVTFTDVATSAWYYEPVKWACAMGVTDGISDDQFGPSLVCTRGQVVTFLWKYAGKPAPKSRTNPFEDVVAGSWYEDAVLWAVENGITDGVDAMHFAPTDSCDRTQILGFLWKYAGKSAPKSRTNPFEDVVAGSWYENAVLWAIENKVTDGVDTTHFAPNAICDRAQAVTFMYKNFAK